MAIPLSQIPNAPQRGAGVTQIRAPRQAPRVDTSVPRLQGAQADASKFKVRGQSPGIDDTYIQNENRANQQISRAVAGVGQVLGGIHDQIVKAKEVATLSEAELAIQKARGEYEIGLAKRTDYPNFGTGYQDVMNPMREEWTNNAPSGVRDQVDIMFRREMLRSGQHFSAIGLKGELQQGAISIEELAESDLKAGNLEGYTNRINQGVESGFFSPAQGAQMVKSAGQQYAVNTVLQSINLDPWETAKALNEVDEKGAYVNYNDVPQSQRAGLQRAARRESGERQSEMYLTMLKDTSENNIADSDTLDNLVESGRLSLGQAQAYKDRYHSEFEPELNHEVFDALRSRVENYDPTKDPYHEQEQALLGDIVGRLPKFQQDALIEKFADRKKPATTAAGLTSIGNTIIDNLEDDEAIDAQTRLTLRDGVAEYVKENPNSSQSDVAAFVHKEIARPYKKPGAKLFQEEPMKGQEGNKRMFKLNPTMKDKIRSLRGKPISASGSTVDKSDFYAGVHSKLEVSSLNGFVPKDGAKYGINTGSPQEWANFFTGLVELESSFRPSLTGDVGRFNGNSNGLFQLSPDDGPNWKLTNNPVPVERLQDPDFNTEMAIAIATKLIQRDGVIAGKSGSNHLGMSAYWGPLRRGKNPADTFQGLNIAATAEQDPHPNAATADLFP